MLSLCAADIDFDPIVPSAVEHKGAIGWNAGILDRRAGLTIAEIPNDLDIVNFKVLACQESDGREHTCKNASHNLYDADVAER